MCRDEREPRCAAVRWLLQTNLGQASAILTALQGSDISAPQMLGVAESNGITVPRMAEMLDAANLPVRAENGSDSGSGVAESAAVRMAAVERDAEVRALQTSGGLPAGASRLPPARSNAYDLGRVAPQAVATAIDVWETNGVPVAGAEDVFPADRLFNTWFKGLDAIGTRTLTMAEMNSVIRSDGGWQGEGGRFRTASGFKLISDDTKGLISPHELHKFVAGFKGAPGTGTRLLPGAGGESGLFARATARSADWGHEGGIRAFWAANLPPPKAEAEAFAMAYIADVQMRLTVAPAAGVKIKLGALVARGYLADPRDRLALTGTIDALRGSASNSPERKAAAAALGENLRERWRAADTLSVSGATAEIQLMETMQHYLTTHGVRVSDPSHRIDAAEVYKLYRTLLKNDQLTSRATVEAWLKAWGVAHVP